MKAMIMDMCILSHKTLCFLMFGHVVDLAIERGPHLVEKYHDRSTPNASCMDYAASKLTEMYGTYSIHGTNIHII
jgi:hypothetical protein